MTARQSGILIPLFSLVSSKSWGIGEFADLPAFAAWARAAGQSFVQVLPLLEIPEHETSPYSALTAMALDPIYISLPALEDFDALGGMERFTDEDRADLDAVRRASRIDYAAIRRLKNRWLRRAHDRFLREEIMAGTPRAKRFVSFTQQESWWLDDYAIFQALRGVHALKGWWDWPEPMARRHEHALERARRELPIEIAYRKYVQWIAAEQWNSGRRDAMPIRVFGDVPFMISADSPDVWTEQGAFLLDASVGVPPDAFSETGQDWGLPPWRWEVMSQNDFAWIRARARRTAALFDGFRIDHLVGLYRMYVRPKHASAPPYFAPPDEQTERWLGEKLVQIYRDTGADVVAEDLGTVPDFVRQSLKAQGVPGFKVFRWERYWSQPETPFIDPRDYAEVSIATTGTHDTEPLAIWWESLPPDDRRLIFALPSVARYLPTDLRPLGTSVPAGRVGGPISPAYEQFLPFIGDAIVRAVLDSGSRLTVFPIQDVFGWRDRINTPATIDAENWTWRLPWLVDQLMELPVPRARAQVLREWTEEASRRP